MNKQELFEKISDLEEITVHIPTKSELTSLNGMVSSRMNLRPINYLRKSEVLELIEQLDEPKKVVIPRFVAEWIEKQQAKGYSLRDAMAVQRVPENVRAWLIKPYENQELFARAWLDGYEVEKEKLYTVKIAEAILTKITRGSNVQYKMLPFGNVSDVFDKAIYTTKLTEQEIKQKDERLWQWAKEVVE